MKYATALILTAALTLMSGCSRLKVKSNVISDYDYSSVKTYEWVSAPQKIMDQDDTYLNENVQIALNNELSGLGWKQVLDSDKADIQVVYFIKLVEQQEYTGPASTDQTEVVGGITYTKSDKKWGYKNEDSDLIAYTVEIGTLSLLLYDAENSKPIWSGTLQTRLDRNTPLEQQKDFLTKISRKIIGRIPVK